MLGVTIQCNPASIVTRCSMVGPFLPHPHSDMASRRLLNRAGGEVKRGETLRAATRWRWANDERRRAQLCRLCLLSGQTMERGLKGTVLYLIIGVRQWPEPAPTPCQAQATNEPSTRLPHRIFLPGWPRGLSAGNDRRQGFLFSTNRGRTSGHLQLFSAPLLDLPP